MPVKTQNAKILIVGGFCFSVTVLRLTFWRHFVNFIWNCWFLSWKLKSVNSSYLLTGVGTAQTIQSRYVLMCREVAGAVLLFRGWVALCCSWLWRHTSHWGCRASQIQYPSGFYTCLYPDAVIKQFWKIQILNTGSVNLTYIKFLFNRKIIFNSLMSTTAPFPKSFSQMILTFPPASQPTWVQCLPERCSHWPAPC